MGIIWTIIIGFVIGLFARFLMPGNDKAGFIMTTILGIVGSVVGTYLGQWMGLYGPGEVGGFIASVLGAMVVLFFARMLVK